MMFQSRESSRIPHSVANTVPKWKLCSRIPISVGANNDPNSEQREFEQLIQILISVAIVL